MGGGLGFHTKYIIKVYFCQVIFRRRGRVGLLVSWQAGRGRTALRPARQGWQRLILLPSALAGGARELCQKRFRLQCMCVIEKL